jgi:hypothetical protein
MVELSLEQNTVRIKKILSCSMCVTIDGGLDWLLDLLTAHTQDLELQAITVSSLISRVKKSPQHPLRVFRPTLSSQALSWQRLLIVRILQLHTLKSSLNGGSLPAASLPHRLPQRTDLVAPNSSLKPLCTDRVKNTVSNSTSMVACVSVVAGTCLPNRPLKTALVYLFILWLLHSNGSTRYNTFNIKYKNPGICYIFLLSGQKRQSY